MNFNVRNLQNNLRQLFLCLCRSFVLGSLQKEQVCTEIKINCMLRGLYLLLNLIISVDDSEHVQQSAQYRRHIVVLKDSSSPYKPTHTSAVAFVRTDNSLYFNMDGRGCTPSTEVSEFGRLTSLTPSRQMMSDLQVTERV